MVRCNLDAAKVFMYIPCGTGTSESCKTLVENSGLVGDFTLFTGVEPEEVKCGNTIMTAAGSTWTFEVTSKEMTCIDFENAVAKGEQCNIFKKADMWKVCKAPSPSPPGNESNDT